MIPARLLIEGSERVSHLPESSLINEDVGVTEVNLGLQDRAV